jgi:hypothetical protein
MKRMKKKRKMNRKAGRNDSEIYAP